MLIYSFYTMLVDISLKKEITEDTEFTWIANVTKRATNIVLFLGISTSAWNLYHQRDNLLDLLNIFLRIGRIHRQIFGLSTHHRNPWPTIPTHTKWYFRILYVVLICHKGQVLIATSSGYLKISFS